MKFFRLFQNEIVAYSSYIVPLAAFLFSIITKITLGYVRRRSLSFDIDLSLYPLSESAQEQMQKLFNYSIVFELFNSGTMSLKKSDFEGDIIITFPNTCKITSVEINPKKSTPTLLAKFVSFRVLESSHEIIIQPFLLKKGENLTFNISMEGPVDYEASVITRSQYIDEIKFKSSEKYRDTYSPLFYIITLSLITLSYLMTRVFSVWPFVYGVTVTVTFWFSIVMFVNILGLIFYKETYSFKEILKKKLDLIAFNQESELAR